MARRFKPGGGPVSQTSGNPRVDVEYRSLEEEDAIKLLRERFYSNDLVLDVEFADAGGLLRLEFCIDRMNPPVVVAGEEATFIEAGKIEFL